MKDFNICIAHRGDPMGLWATIHSCEIELANQGFDYDYIICVNGEEDVRRSLKASRVLHMDTERCAQFLNKAGKLKHLTIHQKSISPPSARNETARYADGKYMFFFDNHCLVDKDYFRRAIADFEHYGMDMLHSTTRFFQGEQPAYEYKLKLAQNFWAEAYAIPNSPNPCKPYRIACGGHGGFAVKTNVWKEVGGYWDGFTGYGGEEVYFDLKMAMLDKINYIDPLVVHWHYAGHRGYARHYSDDYFRNMMMCANIIGGEEWLYKVYGNFERHTKQNSGVTMYDLLMQADAKSREHAKWFASIRKRTLDEQLELFRQDAVPC